MRALVTGGCGFIGSNLARALFKKGWKVTIVDDMSNGHLELLEGLEFRTLPNAWFLDALRDFEKTDSEFMKRDFITVIQDDFSNARVLQSVADGDYDVVFHQAAVPRVSYSVENPAETTHTNISKTISLFEAASGSTKRVVWASSSSVYGGAETMPTPETHDKSPKSPYAWQKSAVEDAAKIFCNLYDIDIVCLRYFNVFGPGQYGDSPYSTAISAWCNAIKTKSALRSDGDGTQSRDLCYVDNVVQANILAAESDMKFNGREYNIACGDRTSNNEILNFLRERFPDLEIVSAPWRPGDVMHTQACIQKVKSELGYNPEVRIWEGLERTLQWWGISE